MSCGVRAPYVACGDPCPSDAEVAAIRTRYGLPDGPIFVDDAIRLSRLALGAALIVHTADGEPTRPEGTEGLREAHVFLTVGESGLGHFDALLPLGPAAPLARPPAPRPGVTSSIAKNVPVNSHCSWPSAPIASRTGRST